VDAHAFDPAERDLGDLKREGFDRCFIALHGRHGEDGTVQGALELLGIPYTGSGVMASAVAMDKVMTKRVWLAEGLPTPRWRRLSTEECRDVREVPDALGLPLIVKPAREGSSFGVTKVRGYSGMQEAVTLAAQYDPDVLCEEFIDGDEVTCPVLGEGEASAALPVIRIQAPDGNYDFEHKYFTDDTLPGAVRPAEARSARSSAWWWPPTAPWAAGLGPRRSDDPRQRPQALPAGDEHLAGHDRPFAGAACRPRPPASATKTCACACWPAPRWTATPAAQP
jgi:D-alanine-D-alanine ligase